MNRPKILLYLLIALLLQSCASTEQPAVETAPPSTDKWVKVQIVTSIGNIELKLDAKRAPLTVENFINYAKEDYYNGLIFHRVIPDFMIQGGGHLPDLQEKPSKAPIKNEADNGLSNLRGTIAMARTAIVDSATSQFFINLIDNTRLDHQGPDKFGYAVFGKVETGMNVVEAIANTTTLCPSTSTEEKCTDKLPSGMKDVPQEPIIIKKVNILE